MITRRTALAMLAAAPAVRCFAQPADLPRPPAPTPPRLDGAVPQSSQSLLKSGVEWGEQLYEGTKPAFRARAPEQVQNVRLHDVATRAAPEWLVECDSKASITDAVIERIDAQCTRGCIRVRGDSARVQIRDIQAQGSVIREQKRLPGGIVIAGNASDVTIERAVMRGFQTDWGDSRYWNGDGFASERGNRRIVIRDCAAIDNSDGGFDMKAKNSRFEGVNLAQGNARNFRFWESWDAATLVSLEPVLRGGRGGRAHIGIYGGGEQSAPRTIRIGKLVARASGSNRAALFHMEAGGPFTVVIDSHDIALPQGTALVDGEAADALELVWRSGPPQL